MPKLIRAWRVDDRGAGVSVFYDPSIEQLELRDLTAEEKAVRLDSVGSVSALDEDEGSHVWDARVIEEQHRRFLNGS